MFCAVLVVLHSSRFPIIYICSKVNKLEQALEKMKDLSNSGQRLQELEKQAGNQEEMLSKIDQAVEEKINSVTTHFEDMEKELGEINERLNLLSSGSAVLVSGKKSMAAERQSTAMVVTNFTYIFVSFVGSNFSLLAFIPIAVISFNMFVIGFKSKYKI